MKNQSENLETRRDFCARAAALALVGGLAAIADACSSPTGPDAPPLTTVNATRGAGGVTVAVAGTPLATVGGAALVHTAAADFLVAQTSANTFVALDAICTHQTCTITGFTNASYVCPCHGSTFDLNGRVRQGPAQLSLRQYPTQFVNGTLTITA